MSARTRKRPVASIDHDRERMRGWIALALVGLLAAVVLAVVLGIAIGTVAVHDLKELSPILGPLVALVGAATGFYFGGAKK